MEENKNLLRISKFLYETEKATKTTKGSVNRVGEGSFRTVPGPLTKQYRTGDKAIKLLAL